MLAISSSSALWFLPFVAPIAIWVAFSDLKFMKIPNLAVYATVAVFLVIGLIALPFGDYLWRLSHLAVVLAIGFVANMARLIGAGDAKFAAAMAPFFALGDLRLVMILFAALLLAATATHRILRAIPAVRRMTPDWLSWTRGKDFPMGLTLSGLFLCYLGLGVAWGA